MLINREKSSHYYTVNNGQVEPFFEVPKKSGEGMRKVTITDAKLVGALPSVTSKLRVLAKPSLEAWKMEQAILSALTLPRQKEAYITWVSKGEAKVALDYPTGAPREELKEAFAQWAYLNPPSFLEDDQEFAKRVVIDSEKEGKEAGEFGTAIHDNISLWLRTKAYPDLRFAPYLESFMVWADGNIEKAILVEKLVHHTTQKYAGTMDCLCQLITGGTAVLDYKTQHVKRNAKGEKVPVFYEDSWPLQLAAYAACDELVEPSNASWPALISIIIDSSEPGPVYVKEWKPAEHYWKMFLHCSELWNFTKGYNV